MKKLSYIILVCGFQVAYAQHGTTSFFDDLYIGINGSGNYIHSDVVGLSNFFKNFKFEKDSKDEFDLGFGLNISKQIMPYLNLGVEYNRGSLTGTELDINGAEFIRHVNLKYENINLSSKWYLNRMFRKRLKATEVGFYLMGGIGMVSSEGDIYRKEIDSKDFNKYYDYKTSAALTTSIGLGLNFKVSARTDFEIGATKYFSSNNSLDGIDYRLGNNTKNDQFYKFFMGLNILLGNKRKSHNKWNKTSVKVDYGYKRSIAKSKSDKKVEPGSKSNITRIEEQGSKTIVYADGRVEKVKPSEESKIILVRKANDYPKKLDEDNVIVENNKEIIDVQEISKVQLRKSSQLGIENVLVSPPSESKITEVEVDEQRSFIKPVTIVDNPMGQIEIGEKDNFLNKTKYEAEEIIDRSIVNPEVFSKKKIKTIENQNSIVAVPKKEYKSSPELLVVDSFEDDLVVVESGLSLNTVELNNNSAVYRRNNFTTANELNYSEAREIQSNYNNTEITGKEDYNISSGSNFVSKQKKYQYKTTINSHNRHKVFGESSSIKEPLVKAKMFDKDRMFSDSEFKSNKGPLLIRNSNHQVLKFENGIGFLSNYNKRILEEISDELKLNENIQLILKKEKSTLKDINRKNSKRILSIVDYLKSELAVPNNRIKIIPLEGSNSKEQLEIIILTE